MDEKALVRAVKRAMEWAGSLPAKESVKLRPSDWTTICDLVLAPPPALSPGSTGSDEGPYCWAQESGGSSDPQHGGEPPSVEFLHGPAPGAFPLYRGAAPDIEACAKLAETWRSPLLPGSSERLAGHEEARAEIATAIRAMLSAAGGRDE